VEPLQSPIACSDRGAAARAADRLSMRGGAPHLSDPKLMVQCCPMPAGWIAFGSCAPRRDAGDDFRDSRGLRYAAI
jgi:hypothetical protein